MAYEIPRTSVIIEHIESPGQINEANLMSLIKLCVRCQE